MISRRAMLGLFFVMSFCNFKALASPQGSNCYGCAPSTQPIILQQQPATTLQHSGSSSGVRPYGLGSVSAPATPVFISRQAHQVLYSTQPQPAQSPIQVISAPAAAPKPLYAPSRPVAAFVRQQPARAVPARAPTQQFIKTSLAAPQQNRFTAQPSAALSSHVRTPVTIYQHFIFTGGQQRKEQAKAQAAAKSQAQTSQAVSAPAPAPVQAPAPAPVQAPAPAFAQPQYPIQYALPAPYPYAPFFPSFRQQESAESAEEVEAPKQKKQKKKKVEKEAEEEEVHQEEEQEVQYEKEAQEVQYEQEQEVHAKPTRRFKTKKICEFDITCESKTQTISKPTRKYKAPSRFTAQEETSVSEIGFESTDQAVGAQVSQKVPKSKYGAPEVSNTESSFVDGGFGENLQAPAPSASGGPY